MKRLLLLPLLLLIGLAPLLLVGCEELGFSKKRSVYPNAGSNDGGTTQDSDEGGIPAGPGPTITAQPGDIQI
jgi:hypothetical protein